MKFSVREILGLSIFGGSRRGGGSTSRICGPRDLKNTFLFEVGEDEIRSAVAKIEKFYGMVSAPRRNGFCFGLLDPFTNIVLSSAISESIPASEQRAEGGGGGEQAADMAIRSLSGLIAFLTRLFPYLPDAEAVRYLDSAGWHPIVACCLIVCRRGMCEYDPCSLTALAEFEAALRCAAVAAGHPDPQHFVQVWKRFSPYLDEVYSGTQDVPNMVNCAEKYRDSGMTMEKSWDFAQSRLVNLLVKELPLPRVAMKRMLLATIHGFYLQALGRLPTTEICTQYHRSLLMGGYCYGPLDPTSNIILNTLWYEQRFPPTIKDLAVQMISTECLWRIAARSLYGLVSFLCTRYPALTSDLAMQRLLVARADLRAADPSLALEIGYNAPDLNWSCYQVGCKTGAGELRRGAEELQRRAVDSCTPSSSAAEAYAAAATAAFHPNPSEQKEFLGSQSSMLQAASTVLHQGSVLSDQDILSLFQLFRFPSLIEFDQRPTNKGGHMFMSKCRGRFWGQHDRICTKVNIALATFNKDKEFKYKVHVICGVNELVSGPEFSTDVNVRGYNPWTPSKYYHSHINFLATCANSKPVLFFAECSNHGTDKDWCVPVEPMRPLAEHARCIYCEYEGDRIVHPAMKGFHGGDREFEKVLRGEPLFEGSDEDRYSNNRIITDKQHEIDWVHSVRDDYIYTSSDADTASVSNVDLLEDFRRNIDFA